MILKYYVVDAKERIEDLLDYQNGADEIRSVIGDSLVFKLQNVYDELEILARQLDFQ